MKEKGKIRLPSAWLNERMHFSYKDRIYELLAEHNMTQTELSKECTDIGESTVPTLLKKLERIPALPTLLSVCYAFDITLDAFFKEPVIDSLSPVEQEIVKLIHKLPEEIRMNLLSYLKFTLDPNRK